MWSSWNKLEIQILTSRMLICMENNYLFYNKKLIEMGSYKDPSGALISLMVLWYPYRDRENIFGHFRSNWLP